MDEEEIWKDIYHYEGIYQVSSWSRIRSIGRYVRNAISQYWRNGQIIKPGTGGTPRITMFLWLLTEKYVKN